MSQTQTNFDETRDRVVERWDPSCGWVQESVLLSVEGAQNHVAFENRNHPKMKLRIVQVGLA